MKKLAVYDKKKLAVSLRISVRYFKLRHMTYKKYCVEIMFHLFIEKDFESLLVFDEVLIL